MSTYDDSSLFLYPSGYKASVLFAQKPMDANGQLAFTRSNDTATRVASNGLIEKVRTNLAAYSEQFDNAAWLKNGITVTANATTAPNGTMTADKVVDTLGGNNAYRIFNSVTLSAISYSASFYVKAAEYSWVYIRIGNALRVWFDVSTGVVGINDTGITGTIQSAGNGWYRCTAIIATATAGSGFSLLGLTNANGVEAYTPSTGGQGVFVWGAQLETGDIATDYIATTTAAVSVGPVANIPRIDYLGGGCGKLLLEPQRSNVALYSEQFNTSSWTKSGSGVGIAPVVTANNGISPDGYQNADKIDLNLNGGTSSSDWSWVYQSFSATGTQPQAFSIYLKAATAGDVGKVIRVGFISYVTHTLTADWTRVVLNQTFGTTSTFYIGFRLRGNEATANTASLYAWGAQLEQNAAYSSSYIPTLAASATRGVDSAILNNSAALPTAYPFTFFAEINYDRAIESQYPICLIDSSTSDTYINLGIGFTSNYEASVTVRNPSTSVTVPSNSTLTAGRHKLAVVVTSSNIKIFSDGVLRNTGNNTVAFNAGMNDLLIGQLRTVADTGTRQKLTSQALVFKSALSDADAIALTTL